jgi:LAO/AO transport system kinase
VINKSDRPGADKLRQEVEVMLGIRRGNAFRHVGSHHGARTVPVSDRRAAVAAAVWEPPVIETVATKGEGVTELISALDQHAAYLGTSGGLAMRRRERLRRRLRAVTERAVRQWVWDVTRADDLLADRLDDVAEGRRNPYEVAAEVVEQVKSGAVR